MRTKILSLLVLLLTAATGAWAQATFGVKEITPDMVPDSWNGDNSGVTAAELANWGFKEVTADEAKTWTGAPQQVTARLIYTISSGCETLDWEGGVQNGGSSYIRHSVIYLLVRNPDYSSQYDFFITTEPAAPDVEVTTNAASEGATFTEATFAMPTNDVTVDYELVRDLSVETALNIFVIENEEPVALTEDSRLRIAKNGDNGYLPVNTLTCAFIDGIENVTMTPQQIIAAGMTPVFYLLGENDTWTPVPAANINPQTMLPTNIAPGQTYRMTLVANEGSIYDGETAPTFTITLFEGYPVEIAAGEYATFYKDENLYVEDEDAKLYTISSVEGDKAYLSSAFDAAPANSPLLVFNSSEKPKTILLIPTEQEPNLAVDFAPEFQGTLEGTTLQALLGCDSYVFNGKAFVWVKDEIAVPANKCWLAITTGTPNNAKTITIVFDEDATGVRSVDNGQLTMDNDVWYDLNGRKLNKKPTTKGVYIFNGRKVVVK